MMVEVIEKREILSKVIAEKIREKLEEEPTIKAAINIIEVNVRSIRPPTRVVEAIEEKLRAQQEAEKARYILIREMRLANATKMRLIIESEGRKQATIIEAEGIKQALELIKTALGNRTDLLIWYLFVKGLEKFNGTIVIFVTPGINKTLPVLTTLPLK